VGMFHNRRLVSDERRVVAIKLSLEPIPEGGGERAKILFAKQDVTRSESSAMDGRPARLLCEIESEDVHVG